MSVFDSSAHRDQVDRLLHGPCKRHPSLAAPTSSLCASGLCRGCGGTHCADKVAVAQSFEPPRLICLITAASFERDS
jgi:hypothetical protein